MAAMMSIGTRSVAERVAHELEVSRCLGILAAMESAAERVGYRFVKSRQPHELPILVVEAMAECAGLDTEIVLAVLRDLGIRLHPAKDASRKLAEEGARRQNETGRPTAKPTDAAPSQGRRVRMNLPPILCASGTEMR